MPRPATMPTAAPPDPGAAGPEAAGFAAAGDDPDREAALARLFQEHYSSMLRLAVLLGADDAEDIVAEAFYQLYRRWRRLRGVESALPYLRSVVCNLSRMRLRHLQVIRRHAGPAARLAYPATLLADRAQSSAETEAMLHDDHRALVGALKQLPARQREALVLRYWLSLREAEIAAAMGISCGAVKSHTSRGMAALSRVLEERR